MCIRDRDHPAQPAPAVRRHRDDVAAARGGGVDDGLRGREILDAERLRLNSEAARLIRGDIEDPFGGVGAPVYHEYASIQRDAAKRILDVAADQARGLGVEAETLCVEDLAPAQAIVDTATARGCDVIAMSSHGRRGLRRMILGSVAAEVLASSPVPVLIVR